MTSYIDFTKLVEYQYQATKTIESIEQRLMEIQKEFPKNLSLVDRLEREGKIAALIEHRDMLKNRLGFKS